MGGALTDDKTFGAALRSLWRLGWPLALVQLNLNLTGAVDTALAGRVDALTLAGTGLGAAVFATLLVLSYGAGLGSDPLMAQAIGASSAGRAQSLLWQGVRVGLWASVPIVALGIGVALGLEALGVSPDVAAVGRMHLWGRLAALPAFAVAMVLRSFLQASGAARVVLWSAVIMNICNFVGDWLLLFGDAGLVRLGLPAMGVPALGALGIGISSAFAVYVQLGIMVWAARVVMTAQAAPAEVWSAGTARAARRKIVSIGTPACAQMAAEVGVFALVSVWVSSMGATIAGAHQTALMLASLAFSVCVGFGVATGVKVGHAIGRGDSVATRRVGLAGGLLGVGFMTLSATSMWAVPEFLLSFLTSDPAVIATAVPLLRIAGIFQIADGAQAVASGALRGAGQTRWAFGANMVAYWVIALPFGGYLTRGLNMGPAGLWWGLTLGLCLAAVALCRRFWQLSSRPIEALRV